MLEMDALMTSLLLVCATMTFAAWLVAAHRRLVTHLARRFVALPRVEQVLLVLALGVMTVCAQKSGTNEVDRVAGVSFSAENGVFNAEISEIGSRGEENNVLVESGSGVSPLQNEEVNSDYRSGQETASTLTDGDYARGFVLTQVGTNEVFDFSAPEGANYATNWMLHGGATART
jgi:hypothetical protein